VGTLERLDLGKGQHGVRVIAHVGADVDDGGRPDERRGIHLVERRAVVGLGVDTLGIDPGAATDFVVHRQVSHPAGVWHLEGLQNLGALPPQGATLFVGVLPLVDGSGSPARVLALVP
jgi:kynurenine formamidase